MFFDGWEGLVRIVIAVPIVYLGIILATRIAGKRSTSQMNNFDWIVTVATGAIAGAGILQTSVTISECLLAIGSLLLLQYLLTRLVYHNETVGRAVKARPVLLVSKGNYLRDNMRHERVTEGEITSALRNSGLVSIEDVQWVILEPDATFSVIAKSADHLGKANFKQVAGFTAETED